MLKTGVCQSLLFAEEETVGPSKLRLSAGVGVVAAVVMLSGPTAAVSIADPGGSHGSHSGRDRADSRGGVNPGFNPGGSDRDSTRRVGRGSDDDDDGWSGGQSGGGQKSTSDNRTAQRSTSSPTTSGSTASLAPQATSRGQQAAAQAPAPDPQTPGAGPGSDTLSGTDVSGQPDPQPVQPRVVVGDGRSPGVQEPTPDAPRVTFAVPEVAAPPAEPLVVPPPPTATDHPRPQRYVPQFAESPSRNWSDPLWGLAGLVLIPAAGAVLGYRQAKAARDAEVLTRT